MKIDNCKKREILGLLFWAVIGLVVMITVMLLAGCATPKNTDRTTNVDYSGDLQQMQSRMDSLMLNMRLMSKEISEKVSNLKIKNTTTNLSPPDSTGKQYPTQVSETTVNKEEKENTTTDTEINVTIQQLVTEVNELRQKLDAVITEKEKVKEVSWWELHRMDVYAVVFALVIVGWLVYKKRKK